MLALAKLVLKGTVLLLVEVAPNALRIAILAYLLDVWSASQGFSLMGLIVLLVQAVDALTVLTQILAYYVRLITTSLVVHLLYNAQLVLTLLV